VALGDLTNKTICKRKLTEMKAAMEGTPKIKSIKRKHETPIIEQVLAVQEQTLQDHSPIWHISVWSV
jgi:hypothetical protein